VFNPGSVGQPRDGDPRASYAIVAFEKGETEVQLRRVDYDVDRAAEKILAAGLPEQLAARLFEGW
jgi:diadenosine tetraphosphatase ApaH/serine/threonine PP2A family protein phosphatase